MEGIRDWIGGVLGNTSSKPTYLYLRSLSRVPIRKIPSAESFLAMAGEGFALGWRHTTQTLTAQGLLAARDDWAWETGAGFYLVWSRNTPLIPQAQRTRDWIISVAALDGDPAVR